MNTKLEELNRRLDRNNLGRVYNMSEFDEVFSKNKPMYIVKKASSYQFNIDDYYFEFDGYGSLVSYEGLESILDKYMDVK